MTKPKCSLNLDPGFAWLGWSVVNLHQDGDAVAGMGLLRTVKANTKRKVGVADDNFCRARLIAHELRLLVEHYSPSAVCFEAFRQPRNAAVAAKLGMTYGIIATLSEVCRLPVVSMSPQEIRRVCGKATSKDEVARVAFERFREDEGSRGAIRTFLRTYKDAKASHVHAWDSLAVAIAAADSDVVNALRF